MAEQKDCIRSFPPGRGNTLVARTLAEDSGK